MKDDKNEQEAIGQVYLTPLWKMREIDCEFFEITFNLTQP